MLSFLGGLFNLIPGVTTAITAYLTRKADTQVDGFKTAVGADNERARMVLDAHLENNRLKAAQNGWWGAKAIILIAGVPAAFHMALIFLDSSMSLGCAQSHGCLGVPAPPAPYDAYEWEIVKSFFLVLPAMPLVSAASAWLTRR